MIIDRDEKLVMLERVRRACIANEDYDWAEMAWEEILATLAMEYGFVFEQKEVN